MYFLAKKGGAADNGLKPFLFGICGRAVGRITISSHGILSFGERKEQNAFRRLAVADRKPRALPGRSRSGKACGPGSSPLRRGEDVHVHNRCNTSAT